MGRAYSVDDAPQRGFSASNAFSVTPSNNPDDDFPFFAEYLYIGGDGSGDPGQVVRITVIPVRNKANGDEADPVSYEDVPVGQYLWIRCRRVNSTGTTANITINAHY